MINGRLRRLVVGLLVVVVFFFDYFDPYSLSRMQHGGARRLGRTHARTDTPVVLTAGPWLKREHGSVNRQKFEHMNQPHKKKKNGPA